MNRINIITLGVRDLDVSVAFYRLLGFKTNYDPHDAMNIAFFANQGTRLALYPLADLALDIGINEKETGNFNGFTIAYNAKTKEEVDTVFALAQKHNLPIVKKPQATDWGGYGGYIKDPDNNYIEVAYGAMWEFDACDMLKMEV